MVVSCPTTWIRISGVVVYSAMDVMSHCLSGITLMLVHLFGGHTLVVTQPHLIQVGCCTICNAMCITDRHCCLTGGMTFVL